MALEHNANEIEAELARFEQENPELVKTIELLGLSIKEYDEIIQSMWTSEIITSNATGD